MMRRWLVSLAIVLALIAWADLAAIRGQQGGSLLWIWYPESGEHPARSAPPGARFFRKTFYIDRPFQIVVDEAELDIVADDAYTVWINGQEVGRGHNWRHVDRYDVRKLLRHGKNVIAVRAVNHSGPAGLLVRLGYVPNGQSKLAVMSDHTWKVADKEIPGWQSLDFDDSAWKDARVLGSYARTGPWRDLQWQAGSQERFHVPPGFRVEVVVPSDPPRAHLPQDLPFSLINLCFDARGRLLVSLERGPILLCTSPDQEGVLQSIKPYCEQVRNCQGMCWVRDALWLVGDGPQGTGLYRCRDTDGDDRTDEVRLVHRFAGGMGEHGPHAILHGPDDWLYLVVGNHAWCQIGPDVARPEANPERLAANSPLLRWPTGRMGPGQFQPGSTEDVLLPRQNDARGHAANITAPGGTIWRLDHQGQHMSLIAAGFRNQYDAAFTPWGELFTFDSDMEWDEGLPWYRPVRICHVIPGAEFGWRTGSSNLPPYYLDTLPGIYDTGRGSPVGVEWYDHHAFPARYRTLYLADWALGVIYAVHLTRQGASYKAQAERFCTGAPMNVTDIAVGPEGGLYFTLGGRGTQGGVYRIVYKQPHPAERLAQLLSPWTRAQLTQEARANRRFHEEMQRLCLATNLPGIARSKGLTALQATGLAPDHEFLARLATDPDPQVRASALFFLGVRHDRSARDILVHALADSDALVQRHACEASIRAGIEPPVASIWPLLGSQDRFLRTAARLVLERIEPPRWADRLTSEPDVTTFFEGIVALCKHDRAEPYAEPLYKRLATMPLPGERDQLLNYLRVVQLLLLHTRARPQAIHDIAHRCYELFPHRDDFVSRELAILLTWFAREKMLEQPVHAALLQALRSSSSRPQQIHYFYCLRLLHQGWSVEEKRLLLSWFEDTKNWTGGYSFVPYLENILRDLHPVFSREDLIAFLRNPLEMPHALAVLLTVAAPDRLPQAAFLAATYEQLMKAEPAAKTFELREAVISALSRMEGQEVSRALRHIADLDPDRFEMVVRALINRAAQDDWPYLVRGLKSSSPIVVSQVISVLLRMPQRPPMSQEPKSEEAQPYRDLLLAATRLPEREQIKVVRLLRKWTGKRFATDDQDCREELQAFARWFSQTFPKEPPLPNLASLAGQSKWKFDELLSYLEKNPNGKNGDPARGRVVFEKANCIKCHKFGNLGEGLGPDLTTLKSRFKRADVLESLLYPSKAISDQYRGSTIVTKQGLTLSGLAAPQGDTLIVLQSDGSKVTLKKEDVAEMVASTISPMPEKLLDDLTLQEIADLFAFLESEPPK